MDKELKKISKALIFNENPKKVIKEAAAMKLLGEFDYKKIKYTYKILKQLKQIWIR